MVTTEPQKPKPLLVALAVSQLWASVTTQPLSLNNCLGVCASGLDRHLPMFQALLFHTHGWQKSDLSPVSIHCSSAIGNKNKYPFACNLQLTKSFDIPCLVQFGAAEP